MRLTKIAGPDAPYFIERLAALMMVVAVLGAWISGEAAIALGIAAGGALSVVNFYVLRLLIGGIMRAANPPSQAVLAMLLMVKFTVMGFAVYWVVGHARLNISGLLIGVSVVVLAVLAEGFRLAVRGNESNATDQHAG